MNGRVWPINAERKAQWQKGVFAVEFAVVVSVLALMLGFVASIVAQQAIHGHLQRLSYSGASLIKERSKLFQHEPDINERQARQLYLLLRSSMARTMAGFDLNSLGMFLEQVQFDENDLSRPVQLDFSQGKECRPARQLIQNSQLFLKASNSSAVPLYRVTLCYHTQNWFSTLISSIRDQPTTLISSSAIMPGR